MQRKTEAKYATTIFRFFEEKLINDYFFFIILIFCICLFDLNNNKKNKVMVIERRFYVIKWIENSESLDLNVDNLEAKLRAHFSRASFTREQFNSGYVIGNHSYDQDKVLGLIYGRLDLDIISSDRSREQVLLDSGDIVFIPKNTVLRVKFHTDCQIFLSKSS